MQDPTPISTTVLCSSKRIPRYRSEKYDPSHYMPHLKDPEQTFLDAHPVSKLLLGVRPWCDSLDLTPPWSWYWRARHDSNMRPFGSYNVRLLSYWFSMCFAVCCSIVFPGIRRKIEHKLSTCSEGFWANLRWRKSCIGWTSRFSSGFH